MAHQQLPDATSGDHRYMNESLLKGLSVLLAVAEAPGGLTVADLASQLGLDYSTAYRLSTTLLALGYLHRDAVTKVFRPGPSVLRLGYAYVQGLDVHDAALGVMQEVSKQVNETVHLSALDGDAMVLLDAVQPDHFLTTRIRIGARYPVHCSASGKVALAGLRDANRRAMLGRLRLERLTEATITDRRMLEQELVRVRVQGYATNIEEHVVGVQSVAAPIVDHAGAILAVMDVAIPSARITPEKNLDSIRETVVRAASVISAAVGARR